MSWNNPNPLYQNMGQPENLRRPRSSRSIPIACCVCDKVFFDNVSLVLHFECHLKDETASPRQQVRGDPASLLSGRHLSSSLPQFRGSSLNTVGEVGNLSYPIVNDCFRPYQLPATSVITPNVAPINISLVNMPMLKPRPPIAPCSDAGWNLSQGNRNLTMGYSRERSTPASPLNQYKVTSPSTDPLSYSQLGLNGYASSITSTPPLQLRGQQREQVCFSGGKSPHIKPFKKPRQEIVVISDDEEDKNKGHDNKNAAGIDLTLRL